MQRPEDSTPELIDIFMQHISNLFDTVLQRPDVMDLIALYNSGDLVFQIHDGQIIIGRQDIVGPPDSVPEEWTDAG
jgi:hypothetical protein